MEMAGLAHLLSLVGFASNIIGIYTKLVLVFLLAPLQQYLHRTGRQKVTSLSHQFPNLPELKDRNKQEDGSYDTDRKSTAR